MTGCFGVQKTCCNNDSKSIKLMPINVEYLDILFWTFRIASLFQLSGELEKKLLHLSL